MVPDTRQSYPRPCCLAGRSASGRDGPVRNRLDAPCREFGFDVAREESPGSAQLSQGAIQVGEREPAYEEVRLLA